MRACISNVCRQGRVPCPTPNMCEVSNHPFKRWLRHQLFLWRMTSFISRNPIKRLVAFIKPPPF